MNNKVLIVLAVALLLGIATYLIIECGLKKWKCVEGTCEKVLGGDFSSLEKCQKSCQRYKTLHHKRIVSERRARAHGKDKDKKVTWSPELVDYEPQ